MKLITWFLLTGAETALDTTADYLQRLSIHIHQLANR